VTATAHTPAAAARAAVVDHPALVPAEVECDQHVGGAQQRDLATHGDVVPVEREHVVAQGAEVDDELLRDATRVVTGEHEHAGGRVGEVLHRVGQTGGVDRPQRALHVVELELEMTTDDVSGRWLTDALGGGPQLAGERRAARTPAAPVKPSKPSLRGESNDRRRA
jgi:hypothetical protein